jgi:hypothetical protein
MTYYIFLGENIQITDSESSHAVPARPPGNASLTEGEVLVRPEGLGQFKKIHLIGT